MLPLPLIFVALGLLAGLLADNTPSTPPVTPEPKARTRVTRNVTVVVSPRSKRKPQGDGGVVAPPAAVAPSPEPVAET